MEYPTGSSRPSGPFDMDTSIDSDEMDGVEVIPESPPGLLIPHDYPVTNSSQFDAKVSPNEQLDYYFSILLEGDESHTYSEVEISEITNILRSMDDTFWVSAPRLYIVLRRINLLDLFHEFIANSLSDTSFPFSDHNLPPSFDRLQRRAFVQTQSCVLTEQSSIAQCERGQHCRFADQSAIPFRSVSLLGSGGFAQVEKVKSTITGLEYARKILDRRSFRTMRDTLPQFEREISTLKKLRHQHIVEVITSYTDPQYAAIIMAPVADCDLSVFLRRATNSVDERSYLPGFFGCLATALQYLHEAKIRHKDIKPQNILVKNNEVLLTDFGLARDCNDRRSTTEGWTAMSQRYCAPEVADYAPRSYSSDMWSLGCVFLEMFTVFQGTSLTDLQNYFLSNGTQTFAYWSNEGTVPLWLDYLQNHTKEEWDQGPRFWIEQLLQFDRSARPSARSVAFQIANQVSSNGSVGRFCGLCCRAAAFDPDTPASLATVLPTVELSQSQRARQLHLSPGTRGPLASIIESQETDALFVTPARTERSDATPRARASSSFTLTSQDTQSQSQYLASPGLSPQPLPTQNVTPPMSVPPADFPQHRYFTLRSACEVDVETSFAFGTWCSSPVVNKMLDNAYRKRRGRIFLIFCVSKV
jgi:serine/threonine protein kinase